MTANASCISYLRTGNYEERKGKKKCEENNGKEKEGEHTGMKGDSNKPYETRDNKENGTEVTEKHLKGNFSGILLLASSQCYYYLIGSALELPPLCVAPLLPE